MLLNLATHLVQPMMRTLAILGVLLSQVMSTCAPGSMVVCVHQGGRAHIELAGGACCHEAPHSQSASLDHEHEGAPCAGHITCAPISDAPAIVNRCDDESGPCTDYPLVISQLRTENQRSPLLVSDFLLCVAALIGHTPNLGCSACSGFGISCADIQSPTLAALSTVILRC